ncbi:hypothetical protein GCM10022215_42610 [Nocardioides fonticola]|uniref:Restriction endonuclease n=1 Tax=Nocardioides fonticola TaxID=450363 RepID=A0ABP7Y3F9_9ACTN
MEPSHLDAGARSWLSGLPLNRKERYYTGTVLPGLVCGDDFAHLDRFLALCGLPVEVDRRPDGRHQVLVVTEYGFAESVFTPEDVARWGSGLQADTPDVVIAGADWLLAVEAKMFHTPSAADLTAQMDRQAAVIGLWVEKLELSAERVRHVLLLPAELAKKSAQSAHPVVTWEAVLAEFQQVGVPYWANVLASALDSYGSLASAAISFGKNKDRLLTGSEILEAVSSGEVAIGAVGRTGGRHGKAFLEDLASGGWRARRYEVRAGEPPNKNWFTLADFLAAVASADSLGGSD